jgi:hypothetical protein
MCRIWLFLFFLAEQGPAGGLPMLVSERDEIEIGRRVAAEAEKEYGGVLNDPKRQSRLDRVAAKILAQRQRKNIPYSFKILRDDKVINAFVAPGGRFYITKKLFDMCETDGKLAFIVGHEFAHTELQHGREAINRALLTKLGAEVLLGKASKDLRIGVAAVYTLWAQGYSRDQERDADAWGVRYMARGGWDPNEAIRVLKMLGGKAHGDVLSKYLSSHPSTPERIERLKQQIAAMGAEGISLGKPEPKDARPTGSQKRVQAVSRVAALEVTSYNAPYDLEQIVSTHAANYSNIKFVVWGDNFRRTARAQDQITLSGRYDTTQPQTPQVGKMTPPSEVWYLAFNLWDSQRGKGYGGYGSYRSGGLDYTSQTYEAVCEITVSPVRLESGIYQTGGTTVRGLAKSTERRFWIRLPRRLPDVRYEDYKADWQAVQQEAVSRAIGRLLSWVAAQDPTDWQASQRLAERQAHKRSQRWLVLDPGTFTRSGDRWKIFDQSGRTLATVTIVSVRWDRQQDRYLAYYTLPPGIRVPRGLRAYPVR